MEGAPVGHGNVSNGNGRWESFWRGAAIVNGVVLVVGLFWLQNLNGTLSRFEERIDAMSVDLAEMKGNRFTSGDHASLMRKIGDDHEKLWAAIFECGVKNAAQGLIDGRAPPP